MITSTERGNTVCCANCTGSLNIRIRMATCRTSLSNEPGPSCSYVRTFWYAGNILFILWGYIYDFSAQDMPIFFLCIAYYQMWAKRNFYSATILFCIIQNTITKVRVFTSSSNVLTLMVLISSYTNVKIILSTQWKHRVEGRYSSINTQSHSVSLTSCFNIYHSMRSYAGL